MTEYNKEYLSKAYAEIGEGVFETARELFKECGAESDFCVQSIDVECSIFGSWNRLVFRPRTGFKASVSHCTEAFLEAWEKLGKGGQE